MPGVVVISTAIKKGNPELEEARRRGLPVVRRAEMLAELMRLKSNIAVAGTHGKTTTTTMVATLLDAGGFDPTVINGGVIHAYGSNARAGAGEWMVVEADESDGSFNRLPATIAIVTNIDPEHMDHWGSFDRLRQGFLDFTSNIPFYGLAVCCTDDPEVQALVGKLTDRRVVTFGFNAQADVRGVNLRYDNGTAHFDVALQGERADDGAIPMIEGCTLPMPGDHNVSNALAAVAVARHLGMKRAEISAALAKFGGVGRRFTKVAEVGGVTIIDDYGHHPVEIAAVLKAARQATSGPRDRRPPAAPLQPAVHPVRRFLHLLQRSRRGRHRRGLFRRRRPDRRCQPRRSGRRADRPRAPPCPRGHGRGRSGPAGARTGAARRHGRLPWRRYHFGLGERPAGPA